MSIFVERMQKVGREISAPIGFGTSSKRTDSFSDMIIIGGIGFEKFVKIYPSPHTHNTLIKKHELDNNVDAILIDITSSVTKRVSDHIRQLEDNYSSLLTDRLWGVRSHSLTMEQLSHIKEIGCDFIVFDIGETPAIILSDESIGKVIALGTEVDNDLSNAVDCLNLDCVLFISKDLSLPLTVGEMVKFQMVRNRIDKHFIVEIPTDLEPNDVETLRNANISGLLIDLESPKAITKLKKTISDLPVRKDKSRNRSSMEPQLYGNP